MAKSTELKSAPGRVAEAKVSKPQIRYILLHIGKTGGTSLGALIRKLKADDKDLAISKLRHRATLRSTAEKWPQAQIGFVVRDPVSRFVSSFNSRLRSGRPAHEHEWKTHEAIVYAYFPTANELAEALGSKDERMKSAAQYAMKNIAHIRRGYEHHLEGIDALEEFRDRIYCVCDLDELTDRVYEFFAPLGLDESTIRSDFDHQHKGQGAPELSDLAIENLHAAWPREFEIYDYCRENLIGK